MLGGAIGQFAVGQFKPNTVSATVSVTLGALSSSATAKVVDKAAVTRTLQPLVSVAAGKVAVTGRATKTLGPLAATATANVVDRATVTATLQPLTSVATANVIHTATVTKTLGSLASVVTAKVVDNVTVTNTLGAITSVATGKTLVTSVTSKTLGSLTVNATVETIDSVNAAAPLAPLAVSASAEVIVSAELSQVLGALTAIATAANAIPSVLPAPGGGYATVIRQRPEPKRRLVTKIYADFNSAGKSTLVAVSRVAVHSAFVAAGKSTADFQSITIVSASIKLSDRKSKSPSRTYATIINHGRLRRDKTTRYDNDFVLFS